MTVVSALTDAYQHLGAEEESFECCDTRFQVKSVGRSAATGVAEARQTVTVLERQLNAFDESSAVARLNETGHVENPHVARIVRRGLEYADRTDGVFDIRHGRDEHALKAYLRGDIDEPPRKTQFNAGQMDAISISGNSVTVEQPVDLNGLAKGYIVDRARDALAGFGRTGTVNGGGDIGRPHGPVGIESPFGESRPLVVLDTRWNVASSAGYRRKRGGYDHLYNPETGRIGTRHDLVTVVARRDCMEADALATTLAALPLEKALALADAWPDAEALVVTGGVLHRTGGFDGHRA